VTGVVPPQAAHGFPLGLAVRDSAVEVALRFGVDFHPREDCGVEGAVELTVAAAGEAVPALVLPRGGLQGCGSGETGERGFVAGAAGV
jgi:hypothetical protein